MVMVMMMMKVQNRDRQSSSSSVRLLVAARLQTENRRQHQRHLQAATLITPAANYYRQTAPQILGASICDSHLSVVQML